MYKESVDKKGIPKTIPVRPESKVWWRAIITLGIIAAVFLIIWLWLSAILSEKSPNILEGSILIIEPRGRIVEYNRNKIPLPPFGARRETLLDLIFSIKKAAVDDRILGVMIDLGDCSMGWAQAQDIRDAIGQYRKSGKKIFAYGEMYSNIDYFVATACDGIFIMPQGILGLTGLSMTSTYIKGTLDKLGIRAEFLRVKEYKSAPTMFTNEKMEREDREQYEALVGNVFMEFAKAIIESRNMEETTIEELIDDGPFDAEEALAKELVDGVKSYDEVLRDYESQNKNVAAIVRHDDYKKILAEDVGINTGPEIALVYATGGIVRGSNSTGLTGSENMGSDTLRRYLESARRDDSIQAVVLRVDSPGGDGLASEAIFQEVELTRKKKPVVVSMGNVAASGGYYISCRADKILAQPATLTGSIGVYVGKFDLSGFYKKIGINREIIKRGRHSDIFTETRGVTDEERRRVKQLITSHYRGFLKHVAEGRGLNVETVDFLGRGRVWSGTDAKKNGLVDKIGGLMKSIDVAKKLAGIPEESDVRMVLYPRRKSFADMLLGRSGEPTVRILLEPALLSELAPYEIRHLLFLADILKNSRDIQIFCLCPNILDIK